MSEWNTSAWEDGKDDKWSSNDDNGKRAGWNGSASANWGPEIGGWNGDDSGPRNGADGDGDFRARPGAGPELAARSNALADAYDGDLNVSGSGRVGLGGKDLATLGEVENGNAGGNMECYFCHQPGHIAKECPDKPAREEMKCFNCGETGHSKGDCSKPVTCRYCKKEGHSAVECPEAPTLKCSNCKEEGHRASGCKNKHKFDWEQLPDVTGDEAWDRLKLADASKDMDDIREWLQTYAKAVGGASYHELNEAFRNEKFNTYIIALKKDVEEDKVLIDLDGSMNKKHHVRLSFSKEPLRPREAYAFPETDDENMERLKDAGMPFDRGLALCYRCNTYGHTSKNCTEEKMVEEAPKVICVNCREEGHRARDCEVDRGGKAMECHNCGVAGHKKDECPEPPNLDNITCRSCDQTGHIAKECPNKPKFTCRNCGEDGHKAIDCDGPRAGRGRPALRLDDLPKAPIMETPFDKAPFDKEEGGVKLPVRSTKYDPDSPVAEFEISYGGWGAGDPW